MVRGRRGKTKSQGTGEMQTSHQGTGENNQGTSQTGNITSPDKISEMRGEISKLKCLLTKKKKKEQKHNHKVKNYKEPYIRCCIGAELWIIVSRKQGRDLYNDLLKSNKKKKRIEMSDCEGVRSYITGHLQLQRCVIVKWSVKAAKGWTLLGVMGAVGLAGIDGSLGG